MPNHVTNRVVVTGPPAAVAAFRAAFLIEEVDAEAGGRDHRVTRFDFNRIVPRPKILDETESGSSVSMGLLVLGRPEIMDDGFGIPSLDASKEILADFRHRAVRHHAEGIFMAETIFGPTIRLSTGRAIPTRWVGEQHVREDLGHIPSFADWARAIRPEPWMGRTQRIEPLVDPGHEPRASAPRKRFYRQMLREHTARRRKGDGAGA